MKDRFAERLAERVVGAPKLVGWGLLLVTLLALGGLYDPVRGEPRLGIDPSLNEMLPVGDPARRFYDELLQRFGSDDVVLIALVSERLFTLEGLETLQRVTSALQDAPFVERVEGLATALRIRPVEDDVEIAGFFDEPITSASEAARLGDELVRDPLRAGSLVSPDGRATAILVTFERMSERRFLEGNLDRVVLEVARRATTQMPDMRVVMAGTPHVKAEVGRLLARELTFMVPIVLGLMALISCGFFRSLRRGLIPLGAVGLGLIWTLGAMGWSGRDLDVVTTLIPPLVLALGFAYATHVVAGFESTSAAGSPYERAERALAHAAFPVAFTALTTAAGFLSLAGNGLDVIRGFGLFAAFSTGASLLAALTLAPLMLARHAPGSLWPEPSVPVRTRRLDRGFEALASFDVRHANTLLALAVLVCVAAGGAATRIRVNLPVIENFGIESPIRLAYEEVDALFGGANQFYVMLRAEEPGAFEDPAWLKEVAALQTWLDAQPEIGGSISVVQYLEVLNAGLGGDDPPRRGLPDSASLVAQLLLFGANEELDMLLDRAHQVITILVRSTATETREFDLLARRIDARLQALPAGITGRATGNAILLTRAADQIARGQAVSLLIACGMIGGLLILYFRSIGMGLWALAPNLIPVLLYFGLLGATGVTLNNATALMGSIVLGIAVDDTLHLLVEYRRALQQFGDREVAIQRALVRVGRAITCTTLVVCAGLLVVGTSALRNQAEFGLLGAATLALAWFVDVTVTPALCHRFIDRPSREARVKRIAGAA